MRYQGSDAVRQQRKRVRRHMSSCEELQSQTREPLCKCTASMNRTRGCVLSLCLAYLSKSMHAATKQWHRIHVSFLKQLSRICVACFALIDYLYCYALRSNRALRKVLPPCLSDFVNLIYVVCQEIPCVSGHGTALSCTCRMLMMFEVVSPNKGAFVHVWCGE